MIIGVADILRRVGTVHRRRRISVASPEPGLRATGGPSARMDLPVACWEFRWRRKSLQATPRNVQRRARNFRDAQRTSRPPPNVRAHQIFPQPQFQPKYFPIDNIMARSNYINPADDGYAARCKPQERHRRLRRYPQRHSRLCLPRRPPMRITTATPSHASRSCRTAPPMDCVERPHPRVRPSSGRRPGRARVPGRGSAPLRPESKPAFGRLVKQIKAQASYTKRSAKPSHRRLAANGPRFRHAHSPYQRHHHGTPGRHGLDWADSRTPRPDRNPGRPRPGFVALAFDTTPGYVDTHRSRRAGEVDLPGHIPRRRQRVGQWSKPVSVRSAGNRDRQKS